MFSIEGTEQEVHKPGEIINVELTRQDGEGFGFNIIGGSDSQEVGSHNGIFISQINRNGPAYRCGHLDVGDRLIEVNELNLANVKHSEAVNAFRNAGKLVNIKLEKFAQQLINQNFQTAFTKDIIDGPHSTSRTQPMKNFLNSWAGAVLIGAAAGVIAMFAYKRLYRHK